MTTHVDRAAAPPRLADVGPIAQLRGGQLGLRLAQLILGLVLFGVAHGLMYRAGLGLPPWDVLHAGLTQHLPVTIGQALIATAFVVLLAWFPLREKPGVGTVANALIIGVMVDVTLAHVDQPGPLPARIALLAAGIVLAGVAGALYIGAQLGRGPRDGLMTGLHRRTGFSLRAVRSVLEVCVLVVGLALGGSAGVGTIAFALAIGPLTQAFLPRFLRELTDGAP